MKGEIPYTYVGMMHIENMDLFNKEAAPSKEFQDFSAKWSTMVNPDFQMLVGEEVY